MDLVGDDLRTVSEAGESAVLAVLSNPGDVGDEVPVNSANHADSECIDASGVSGDLVGNGDDAAVLGPAAATVVTTDMLVEGTHFRLDLSTWRDLGRRAVAQNVSDVLAMGTDCSRILVAVAVPGRTTMSQIAELSEGIHGEAARSGAVVVGGDLTSANLVVVSVTAIGILPEGAHPVRIDGAAPGQIIALSGTPGCSAAGLALLLAGHTEGPLQDTYRVPSIPLGSGRAARLAGATALTDVSDGLLRDLADIARASGVAADLTGAALPVDPLLAEAATGLGISDVDVQVRKWVLDGGEDHGLLAVFPPGMPLPPGFTEIGRTSAGIAGEVTVDGVAQNPGGWDSARGTN